MSRTLHAIYISLFVTVGIFSTALLFYTGYPYYQLPLHDRPYSDLHHLLKPSGFLGHLLGVVGTVMMITGVAVYMIRKRVKKLHRWGFLKHWLEFHIFMCLVGPILVLFHTAFKFGGIVSVSFWSMVAVVLSGVVGRFIYVQIPRSVKGNELDAVDIARMRKENREKLESEYSLSPDLIDYIECAGTAGRDLSNASWSGLTDAFSDLFYFRKFRSEFKLKLAAEGITDQVMINSVLNTADQEFRLLRRIRLLKSMHKLFRYWHIFHLPFAITMFVIMLIHVGATIYFGAVTL